MTTRRPRLATLLLACGVAHAEGPRLGVELEREKDRTTRAASNQVSLEPGWDFAKDAVIDRAELLIQRTRDAQPDNDGDHARKTRVFARLRHSGKLTEALTYYVRGGVGRSFNSERDFTYGYVEPGLTYELGRWEWTFGWRAMDALHGVDGRRSRKIITGPSYNVDVRNEIELRYTRTSGDERSHSWGVAYVRKF